VLCGGRELHCISRWQVRLQQSISHVIRGALVRTQEPVQHVETIGACCALTAAAERVVAGNTAGQEGQKQRTWLLVIQERQKGRSSSSSSMRQRATIGSGHGAGAVGWDDRQHEEAGQGRCK